MDIKVEFTQDFAKYKKKKTAVFDSQLAARLIHRGIAKQYKPKKSKKE